MHILAKITHYFQPSQRQVSEERTSAVMSATREPEVIPQVGLRMVCPICGASIPKPQMSAHFESCLEKVGSSSFHVFLLVTSTDP